MVQYAGSLVCFLPLPLLLVQPDKRKRSCKLPAEPLQELAV